MYLLDTNACIRILNRSSEPLIARLEGTPPTQISLCSVVKAELLFGARRSAFVEKNLRLLDEFFEPMTSLPFDDRCAAEYGAIRADLERSGTPIGPNDLLIAASARAHDLVLVTHNIREFSRVQGLRFQDWETE